MCCNCVVSSPSLAQTFRRWPLTLFYISASCLFSTALCFLWSEVPLSSIHLPLFSFVSRSLPGRVTGISNQTKDALTKCFPSSVRDGPPYCLGFVWSFSLVSSLDFRISSLNWKKKQKDPYLSFTLRWSNKQQTCGDRQVVPKLSSADWNCMKKHFVTEANSAWIKVTGNIWGRASGDTILTWCHLQFTLNLMASFISCPRETLQSIQPKSFS